MTLDTIIRNTIINQALVAYNYLAVAIAVTQAKSARRQA